MESRFPTRSFIQVCLSRSWGGLEMVAAEFAQSFKDKGYPSAVLCPKDSPLALDCLKRGIPVYPMDLRKRPSPGRSLALRKILNELQATDVVVHQLKDLWIVTPALWGRPQIRALGFSHTFLNYRKTDILHRLLYGRLNQLVALTPLHRDNLLAHLPVTHHQMTLVPNSVDPDRFHPRHRSEELRNQLGVSADQILIGIVGRLDPQKGQMEALEAARLLKERGQKFRLIFVGEETKNSPGLGQKMKEKIKQDSLESFVQMLGFQENPAQWMASLDLFIMPSYAETFGKVLLEAMASAVPVIATKAGGVPDIVTEGQEGLLVIPQSAEALREGIEKLLKDPQLRNEMGQKGREKVLQEFSTRVVQERLDRLFFH